MKTSNLLSTLLLSSSLIYGVGCSKNVDQSLIPTGDELQTTLAAIKGDISSPENIKLESLYFVSADKLSAWNAPSGERKRVGYLLTNEQVKIVSLVSGSDYVEVEVVKGNSTLSAGTKVFVSYKYLSSKKIVNTPKNSRYFMIQNIASEKIRVYEKMCDDGNCEHKLVLETDMLAGEKTKDKHTMTNVGSYNIVRWQKFYETHLYPSWYRDDLPLPPKPGSSGLKWFKKKYTHMRGGMRGAFGWYTAKVGPNADGQWTHGTIGWGADKKRFLERSKGWLLNIVADPRSHGCSRTDNESIAYIRELMDVGAEIVKIYAKEALLDETLSRYDATQKEREWRYILTKNGRMIDGQKADRDTVLASKTDPADFIEEGTYIVDQYPDVVEFQAKDQKCIDSGIESKRSCEYSDGHFKIGSNHGNSYALREAEMSGVFYVDAGLVKGYHHPKSLPRGGKKDEEVPGFMILK